MNAWGHARHGRWSWSWDVSNIPLPRLGWYWRGGTYDRISVGADGTERCNEPDADEAGGFYTRPALAAADDPVGTLSLGLADSGSDPIVSVSIEFAAPRWAHGILGVLAR